MHPGSNWNAISGIKFWDQGKKTKTEYLQNVLACGMGWLLVLLFWGYFSSCFCGIFWLLFFV